jgi:hypothetical protein
MAAKDGDYPVTRSPTTEADFDFLFQVDNVPITPIEYTTIYRTTKADSKIHLDGFENVSSRLAMAIVNHVSRDFGIFVWVDDPFRGIAVSHGSRTPRVTPPNYYVPMMIAYVLLGVIAFTIFVVLVCIRTRNDQQSGCSDVA